MDAFFRSRIAVVSTRSFARAAGRPAIFASILRALGQTSDVTVFRMRSAVELGAARGICAIFGKWLISAVRRRPLPLQCALYSSSRECQRLAKEISEGAFDAVYLDTVRCHALLALLRQKLPHLHIVTDFDDLMSRRASFLTRNRLPLLAGHIGNSLPRLLRLLAEGPFARLVTAHEAAALPRIEADVVARSSATIMLSAIEAVEMRGRLPTASGVKVHAILPAFAVQAEPWKSSSPLRFVFVGGDDLLQNRMAIDHLILLWRTSRPQTPLHIYGRQRRRPPEVPGVHWHGFVENAAAIYCPGSIALVPALVRGGIKTKVAEAWAWGCPVLGNDAAFEGFPVRDYPLILPETAWSPFLLQPAAHAGVWSEAAHRGQEFIRREMSPERFARCWNDIMTPVAVRSARAPGALLRRAAG